MPPLSDDVAIKHLRGNTAFEALRDLLGDDMKALTAFEALRDLLGDDMKALTAMHEEHIFVNNCDVPLPFGKEFAARVRGYLVSLNLEWNQKNLQDAVSASLTD
jgi:hypothetical protein